MNASLNKRSESQGHSDEPAGIDRQLAVDKQDGHEETSFEGIGLSPKAGWYVTAFLNGVGGLLILLLAAMTDAVPQALVPLACVALVTAPLSLLGAKFFLYAAWGGIVRGGLGVLVIGVGGLLIGPTITALTFIILFPLLGVAYLHKPSVSVPFIAVVMLVFPLIVSLNAPLSYVIVSMLVLLMLSAAAVFSQNQLRTIASVTRDLSVTDSLTGLANLRRLQARGQDALLEASRSNEPVTMYAIDLDDFKQVNDRFDHTRGDEVLKAVADALAAEVEMSDLLARRGGDEFAVLVPTLMGRHPEELRERMVAAIRAARNRTCPEVNPDGSVAFVFGKPGESIDELLLRSDVAQHEAKLNAHPERRMNIGAVPIERARVAPDGSPKPRTADHLAAAGAAQAAEELRVARWAQRSLGTAMAWEQAAAMSLVIGVTLAGLSITGITPSLHGWDAAGGIISLLLLPLPFAWASKRELSSLWLRVALVCEFAAITVALLAAGDARWQLVDLYLVPTMFAVYFLSPRKALPLLASGLGLFTVLLWTTTYSYSVVRIIATIVMVTIMAGMLAKARGITRKFTREAVELSVVDPLTGLANLRGLRQRINDEIDRCQVTGKQLALLAIDLDEFKTVNDHYSHARGDEVLVATARAIRDQVRADELVARRGGDEFTAVCVFDDENAPREIVMRTADAISETRLKLCPDTRPTASVGYIVWMPGESCEAFLSRADRELHGAKERSRAVQVA